MNVYKSILDRIGNTPLVEISRLNPSKKVRIFAKLESANPGGSIKDRTALFMIENAEKRGDLSRIHRQGNRRKTIDLEAPKMSQKSLNS